MASERRAWIVDEDTDKLVCQLQEQITQLMRERYAARAELTRLREDRDSEARRADAMQRSAESNYGELQRLRRILAGEDDEAIERAALALVPRVGDRQLIAGWGDTMPGTREHFIKKARAALAAAAGQETGS